MDSFSERMGLRKPPEIRSDTMDIGIRKALWNAFYLFLNDFYSRTAKSIHNKAAEDALLQLSIFIWKDYFKEPIDEIITEEERINSYKYGILYDIHKYYILPNVYKKVKSHILKEGRWHEIYDFLEFVVNLKVPNSKEWSEWLLTINYFVGMCNLLFKDSGYLYTFEKLDGRWLIVPKMSTYEVKEISRAASNEKIPQPTRKHLKDAIEFYKMRGTPKYAESIGESIKAVESLIRYILNDNTVTLSQGLDRLKDCLDSHLREAIKNIYWKTSDDWGARHGFGPGDSEATLEDARFILVVSSAIVNYLTDKVLNNPKCRGESNE